MIEHIGGRKFVFGILLSICATAFVLTGRATVEEWMTFEAIVGATYVIGNVASVVAKR